MAGPPAGFDELINRKYNIQQQQANAASNLQDTQARLMPGEAAARNNLLGAQAYQTRQQGDQVAPLAGAQIGESQARQFQTRQQGNLLGTQNQVEGLRLQPFPTDVTDYLFNNFHTGTSDVISHEHAGAIWDQHPKVQAHFARGTPNAGPPKGHARAMVGNAQKGKGGGLAAILPALMAAGGGGQGAAPGGAPGGAPAPGGMAPPMPGGMGFFGGTAKVPGKGSGNVDKVPAMLAPHEAVLTHGAADALGRGKIAALNAANPPGGSPKPKIPSAPPGKGLVKKKAFG